MTASGFAAGPAAQAVAHGAGEAFEPLLPGLILILPLLGFAGNGILALAAAREAAVQVRSGEAGAGGGAERRIVRSLPTWLGPGSVALAFVLSALNFVRMAGVELHDPVIRHYWSWMATGTFTVDVALQLDQLSMIMMLIITGVGSLIHLFSVGYMRADPGYARYFCYLNLFVFFMLVLVMAASFPLMFVGWEGVGLCSYLLIGFWFEDREKADAGKKAFIVNRIGDFGFLLGIFLLFRHLGAVDYAGVFAAAPETFSYGDPVVTAVALLLLLGAIGKSAQVPLYVWLPDAMAGPTPVSALIHAATMVTAGVYLIARAGVLFALAPAGSAAAATVGAVTALFSATIALKQYDIKKVLAYSTVSQLGFMFMAVGAGAYVAGIFHLMTHAFFKALLFLGAGAVIHSMHQALHATHSEWDAQDMRNMGDLRRYLPMTWVTMGTATLAIAGIWPFAGFFSKDEIIWYTGARAEGEFAVLYAALWVIALLAAILTAVYMTRLMVLTFHGNQRFGESEARNLHEEPVTMTVPLAVLAVLSVFGGWINVAPAVHDSFFGGFGLLPMSEWLHHWLEPVTAAADGIRVAGAGPYSESAPLGGGEVLWAAIATTVAAAAVILTLRALADREVRPADESSPPEGGLARVLHDKWYVDETYDRVIVRPVVGASRFAWRRIDHFVIDGAVNGVGAFVRGLGWAGSFFQTGQVTTYAVILALGALTILGALIL